MLNRGLALYKPFLLPKQILDSIHVEGQGEAKGLVEGIGLGGGDDIAHIEGEDTHAEASTHGEVLTVTLRLRLMMVAGTQGELVVVDILGTYAPLHLLHLFLESSRSIAEALGESLDARHT